MRDRRTGSIAFGAVMAIAGALAAYYLLFTSFSPYDDEGLMIVSLRDIASGHALYSDVYSQYGPLHAQVFGGLFWLTGLEPTNESARWVVLVMWLAIALGYGLAALRLTGQLWIAAVCALVAFGTLDFLTGEPLHPIGMTAALTLALAGALVAARGGRTVALGATGALVAALALTKVNVGVLAGIAVLAAALIAYAPVRRERLWIAAAASLPPVAAIVLLAGNLDRTWVQRFAAIAVGSLGAIGVRAWQDGNDRRRPALVPVLGRMAAGAGVVTALCVLVALIGGTSLGDLVDGALIAPTRHPSVILVPTAFPDTAIALGLLAIGAAFVTGLLRRGGLVASPIARGTIRLAVAATIWLSITQVAQLPLVVSPESGQLTIGALLAWTAVVPPRELEQSAHERFARIAIVLLAALEILQAYPIGFTRVGAGALTFTIVGAIVAADGMRLLALAGDTEIAASARRLAAGAAVALVALFAIAEVARPLQDGRVRYRDSRPLDLPGAEGLRLPAAQTTAYRQLARAARGCPALVTDTGFFSFNGWSGAPTPTTQNANLWRILLDDERQQQIVDALKRLPGYCLIRNDGSVRVGVSNSTEGQGADEPLVRYLDATRGRTVVSADIGQPDGLFTLYRTGGNR